MMITKFQRRIYKNYFKECNVDQRRVEVNALKQENFERIAVLKVSLGSWLLQISQP